MPIYAYRCESCGFAQDILRKISDPPLSVCPECNKDTFRKQVTAAGFQLKGSGWYVTDFRNNGAAPAAGKSSAQSSGQSSESTSGESSTSSTASGSDASSSASSSASTSSAATPASGSGSTPSGTASSS